jgi:tRNA (cytidine/uridine-2'-O-)-methyltransferase
MEIVLFQPQIPQNTGNIARTCAVTNTKLILIRPLGFQLTDRFMQRAGLDYWDEVNLTTFDTLDAYLEQIQLPFYFFSSKAIKKFTEVDLTNCALIFGSESHGLPPEIEEKYREHFVTLPMKQGSRCLNLATSAGIGLYEALRQRDFHF